MPEIRKMLDLSTAHIPNDAGDPIFLTGIDGVHAYDLEGGWLMWVPNNPDESNAAEVDPAPDWALQILRYARRHDCDYVRFDCDADIDPNLPHWEWS